MAQGVLYGDGSAAAVSNQIELRQAQRLDKASDIGGLFFNLISALRVAALSASSEVERDGVDGIRQNGAERLPPEAGRVRAVQQKYRHAVNATGYAVMDS